MIITKVVFFIVSGINLNVSKQTKSNKRNMISKIF